MTLLEELTSYVGRTGLLRTDGLLVPIVVIDAKRAYGNLRLRVRPKDARPLGTVWVSIERVELDKRLGT